MNLTSWAEFLQHNDQARTALLLLLAAGLLSVFFRDRATDKLSQPRAKNRRYWHWPFTRKRIPWKLGAVTVDLRGGRDTIHGVVAGMSGTGKSTAVVTLIDQAPRALVVAFDNSRPILELFQARGWTIWTPGGTLGWDVLSGPAQVVSEALVAGMPESNQSMGIMSGMAQERIWETLDMLDAAHLPRTIDALANALSVRTGNPMQDRACLDWAVRFRRVAKSLGRSLGTDLDLGDAMRHNDKVLILPNRFLSPRDAPLVGAMALVQARRVAQEVGDFLLVVEEAGQAGARQIELNALAQAGRDRGCPLVVITQNMAKLPEEVVNNVKVWVTFAQESSKETSFAAERLRIHPLELAPEALSIGYAWVRAPAMNPRRVHLTLPRYKSYVSGPTPPSTTETYARRIVVEEIGYAPEVFPALMPPPLKVQEILEKIDKSQGDCWLWTGYIDKDGYGLQRWPYPDGRPPNNRPAHQVVWEIVYGRPFPDETFDHTRTCPRHCVNPSHCAGAMSRGDNTRNMHRTRGHRVR